LGDQQFSVKFTKVGWDERYSHTYFRLSIFPRIEMMCVDDWI